MNIGAVLSWLVAWTLLGGVILFLTMGLNARVRCASVRHLAWVAAFLCLSVLPVAEASYSLVHKNIAPAGQGICRPVPPKTSVVMTGLFWVWLSGVGWILIRTFLAWGAVNHWRRKSLLSPEAKGHEFRNIEVRIASRSHPVVAVTWGVFRPVVLLPRTAREWDASRMAAVLAHELGHIWRFDNLTQRLALVVCAIHWFNPVFWFAARRMEAEAEVAADDFAILRGARPSRYAAELLALAVELRSSGSSCPWAQTAMLKIFTMEERLQSVIDPLTRRGSVPLLVRAKIVGVFAGVAIGLMVSTSRLGNLIEALSAAPAHCLVSEGAISTDSGL